MSRYIITLDSKPALQQACAGAKGASLAWLRRNGFNVPPGFVITPATFARFLAASPIQVLTARRACTPSDLQRIRQSLVACRIPDRLAHPMARAYRRLGGPVAIRPSIVAEDTAHLLWRNSAASPAQLDTILNVRGEREVLEAVKQCWASLFNWPLWNDLTQHQAPSSDTFLDRLSIAVVVQRMVDTKAAGVAFSAHPVTGQRCVVIQAAHGPGQAPAQGLAKPHRYVVDARGVLAEAPPATAGAPLLDDHHILRLAHIVRQVASKTKDPQHIQWAWDGAQFYLLHSRPITALVGQRVYSNRIVSDMSPGLIKPLVYSTNTVAMAQNVFGRIFTELIGPNEFDFTLLTKRIRSRIYTDTSLLGDLFQRVGLPANFFEMVSRDERAHLRPPPLTLSTLRAMLRLARFAWRHSRVAHEIVAFLKRHDRDLEHYRQADWSSQDPQDLLAQLDKLRHLHSQSQWYVFIGPMNMMVRNRLLNRLVSHWTPDVLPSDLIRGLIGLGALQPNQELQKLAAQARALGPEIQRLLIEEDDNTIRELLSTSDQGSALVRSVDAFLAHYGFLSPNGTDFTAAPWAETPTLIWRAIARSAASPMQPLIEDVETIRQEAQSRVRTRLNRLHRLFFDRLLASTITYIDLRERTSLFMSQDSYQMRRLFLALADHLVARADLDQRHHIFYLTYDELRQLVGGKLQADAARRLVTTRLTEMEADAQIELPDTICGHQIPTRPILPIEGQEYLVGISGSSGLAQGYARIVLQPVQAPATLTKSDILVVPFTDVGWTPLFSGIGGIVAETGGQLSHTSIVAREYGLPAVVSVKKATHLIKEGQPITVDGDTGRVYLKHRIDS